MTAEEYYKYTTQEELAEELKGIMMYNWYTLIHFAQQYHEHETKQRKTELLSAGSYKQEAMKREYERGIEDGKTIAKHGTTNWMD